MLFLLHRVHSSQNTTPAQLRRRKRHKTLQAWLSFQQGKLVPNPLLRTSQGKASHHLFKNKSGPVQKYLSIKSLALKYKEPHKKPLLGPGNITRRIPRACAKFGFGFSERACLKKYNGEQMGKVPSVDLWPLCAHTWVHKETTGISHGGTPLQRQRSTQASLGPSHYAVLHH